MSIKDSPLLQEHRHLVNERIKEITGLMADGKCTSFDDYKKKSGIISGLYQSIALMEKAIKVYTQDSDEDD